MEETRNRSVTARLKTSEYDRLHDYVHARGGDMSSLLRSMCLEKIEYSGPTLSEGAQAAALQLKIYLRWEELKLQDEPAKLALFRKVCAEELGSSSEESDG